MNDGNNKDNYQKEEKLKEEKLKEEKLRKEKARQRALDTIALEEERKKIKKEEEDKKNKLKINDEKCSGKKEKRYNIRFNYKCRAVCGDKYIILNTYKNEYPFIDVDDFVMYKNINHVNHNKNALVINYDLQGTGREDIELDKQIPVFDIQFTGPVDQMPFYEMKVNDIITHINNKPIYNSADFSKKIKIIKNNDLANFLVYRNSTPIYLAIKISK